MTVKRRETKYTNAVRKGLKQRGHATNAELADLLRAVFPAVSDTTVHRVTARFHGDGDIRTAPPAADGATRYDSNNEFHDHFMCQSCSTLKDIVIPERMRDELERLVDGCCLNGSLVIMGDCKKCKERI